MKQWLIGLFLGCSFWALPQQWQEKHWGVQAQFTANIGTHKTTIGLKINTYLAFDYVQLNLGTAYRYNAFNLGQRSCFGEWRHTAGLVLMAGKETNPINFKWDGSLHQTKRPYSIGYAYLWYFDPLGTSQHSGTWNFGIKRVDIQFENDVFGGQAKDRFRTGNLQVSYRDSLRSLGVGLMIWTGETRHSVWNKTPMEKCPSGYRDLTSLPYGKLNHGVLYVTGQHLIDYKQTVSLSIGDDSEQVRHLFQNRLTHDLILLPKKVQRNTPHYPRLNENGENVFQRKEKRPDKFYFQTGINDLFLY